MIDKQHRVRVANEVIEVIASHGRKFFSLHGDGYRTDEPDRVSRFELRGGRLWFIDKWSQKPVYVAYKGRWRHFSEGGTLQSLIENMGKWIRGMGEFPEWAFGPWKPFVCGGDLWGYGDDMAVVRSKVFAILHPEITESAGDSMAIP